MNSSHHSPYCTYTGDARITVKVYVYKNDNSFVGMYEEYFIPTELDLSQETEEAQTISQYVADAKARIAGSVDSVAMAASIVALYGLREVGRIDKFLHLINNAGVDKEWLKFEPDDTAAIREKMLCAYLGQYFVTTGNLRVVFSLIVNDDDLDLKVCDPRIITEVDISKDHEFNAGLYCDDLMIRPGDHSIYIYRALSTKTALQLLRGRILSRCMEFDDDTHEHLKNVLEIIFKTENLANKDEIFRRALACQNNYGISEMHIIDEYEDLVALINGAYDK